MPDGLYERDALTWAETQADLLRRLAAGERVNAPIDWPHVIEEVRDVGLSELRACRSLLIQAMKHLLKLQAWPRSQAVEHWRDEAGTLLDNAKQAWAPSMRQRMDLPDLYAAALRRARDASDASGPPRSLPEACPFTLDELLAGDLGVLLARISPPSAAAPP